MTPSETAAAVKGPAWLLGGAWMRDPTTVAAGKEIGLPSWPYYAIGRGGPLGDVGAEVVVATFAFFPPAFIERAWNRGRTVLSPAQGAEHYAASMHAWGRTKLAGVDPADLERLAELAERVVDAVDVAGLPLFAAWRALPRPSDPPARAMQAAMLLREHRGGFHALAVLGAGMAPLEAVISGEGGEAIAVFFGWEPPYPNPEPLAAQRGAVEAATDALVLPGFAVLDEAERAELVVLLQAAVRTASAAPS